MVSYRMKRVVGAGAAGLLVVMACSQAAADPPQGCSEDTMIVFDASGSMGGTDLNSVTPRIAKVRKALSMVLPEVAPVRPIGLIVYGPGASNKCESVELRLRPVLDAAETIMAEVDSIVPAGRTPLTAAVSQAAQILDYKTKPATIVLITDGEETCGGQPCNAAGLLKAQGKDLTIHVIGYRDKLATTGPFGSRCMADVSGGTYVSVETTEQLVEALRATLGCPYVTQDRRPSQTRITWGLLTSP
jgi:Ca-activated chloride channel family protein